MAVQLPDDPRTSIWKAVKVVIRSSPFLKGVQFNLYDGQDADVVEPTMDSCPFVSAFPTGGQISMFSEVWMDTPIEITFRFMTAGTDPSNLMNLWGAIEKTFGRFTDSPTENSDVFKFFRDAGVTSYRFVSGSFSSKMPPPNKPKVLEGTGVIRFQLYKAV